MLRHTLLGLLAIGWALALQPVQADQCLDCHTEQTPNQVADWFNSKHSTSNVGCSDCHGDGHKDANDVDKAERPTPATCGS